jgi:hypothetical protein
MVSKEDSTLAEGWDSLFDLAAGGL